MCIRDSLKDIINPDAKLAELMQLMCKHIEQDFRIRISIEVTLVLYEDFFLERLGVGEITVVRQSNSIGRVYIEAPGWKPATRGLLGKASLWPKRQAR